MASHSHAIPTASDEKLELGSGSKVVVFASLLVGILGLAATAFYPPMVAGDDRRGWFAYLTAYAFFLSLSVGGTFFTLLHYVTRAGWSVSVRRVPEALAKVMPVMLILGLPLLYSIYGNKGTPYRWAQLHEEKSEVAAEHAEAGGEAPVGHAAVGRMGTAGAVVFNGSPEGGAGGDPNRVGFHERPKVYANSEVEPLDPFGRPERPESEEVVEGKLKSPVLLEPKAVIVRDLVGLGLLSAIGWWYTSRSKKQDVSGDPEITRRLNVRAAPMLVIFGVVVTMLSYDLLMSLDPVWISTIFGGYFFAGSTVAMFAATILGYQVLQSMGYLKRSVRLDHYHDLSKWQFAFTFFWGYLAFAQFMLLWYSSQPEELTWLARRGGSTAALHLHGDGGQWVPIALVLLFGHLLIPFPGLLSRHVKRAPSGRIFWAVWILVFHFVDMFWIVMPEYTGKLVFGIPEIAAFVGVGGIFVAFFVRGLAGAALRPIKDPRASESLDFQQAF